MNKKCLSCEEDLDIDSFSPRKDRPGTYAGTCKSCLATRQRSKRKLAKQAFVDYKGGACTVCGYNSCLAALEFHHIDPSIKETIINGATFTVFNEKARLELDKCILLCSNCHREEHERLRMC